MRLTPSLALFFATVVIAKGQGTFIYDQQSASNGIATFVGSINLNQPTGQSFTPVMSSVGFVQLQLLDGPQTPDVSATIAVNLWANSIGGTLLGSTDPVQLPGGFFGTATFFFPMPVAVTTGVTHYFQPVVKSGGDGFWGIGSDFYNYTGGTLFIQGQPHPGGLDAWFREGIVPEPSAIVMLGLGFGVLFYARRVPIKRSPLH